MRCSTRLRRCAKILSGLPKEKVHDIKTPMFEKGALQNKVDQLVQPKPPAAAAEAVKTPAKAGAADVKMATPAT